ncbi:maltokinase N-terminal cap-like domain-containing protein [Cellulomonas soli]|uniref:Maltokinase n=1 Tax=Cellulomonas soli TaxID=931535 RepID=A0A512PIK1_9CELL|nr:phosphotransferase [Cellulomonas soli]NYI59939.1 maltokinase [Cellulomonas soli]GEP70962.1 hypothetical protein CSO01_36770 [Cellulomonas soli]
MIVVPPPGSLDEHLLPLLREWLPGRRWFPAKGVETATSLVGAVPLREPGQDGRHDSARILLVRVRAGSIDALLQVPVVLLRRGPGTETETPEAIGELTTADGTWRVLDGAAHPAFVRAWLAAADGPGGPGLDPSTARTVTGEQSNTSVVLRGPDPGSGAILKVLRALAPGENPDVDVPRHLVDVGWTSVPRPLAWLEGLWTDDGTGEPVRGYLGAMSAFVADAEDGFELACARAGRGASFVEEARQLGEVVAGMHAALVEAYGTDPEKVGARGPEVVARSLSQRYSWALSAVPSLAGYGPGVEQVVARVRDLPAAPPRQRVHGDLHLGQVLRAQGRWFVTDFEGEPLAPIEQRTRPDLAVRDVAGLLRSIDYAAAVGGLTGADAVGWSDAARSGLLAGYRAARGEVSPTADGGAVEETLLRALELDKTLYEVVYESRNRPTWTSIPLAGLDRLVGRPGDRRDDMP